MRAGKWIVWIVYLFLLTQFILLKHIPPLHWSELIDGNEIVLRWQTANTAPFHTIGLFLFPSNLSLSIRIQNLVGNVLLFVPFGFLLPVSSGRCRRFFLTAGAAAGLSFLYEVIQLVFGFGSFDVDDLLLNTAGGLIGYGLFIAFRKRKRRIL